MVHMMKQNRIYALFCADSCRGVFPVLRVRACAGFTLIELLIVLILLAILLALAMPSFDATLKRYRVGMAAHQIASALQFARIEAIRARRNVTVLQTTAPVACTNGPSADWHCGVDVQETLDGATDPTTVKTISASNLGTVHVQMNNAKATNITFSPQGFATDCAACTNVAAGDSFIHVWPAASGSDPAAAGIVVSTVCTTRAGKVRVVPQYVTASADCA